MLIQVNYQWISKMNKAYYIEKHIEELRKIYSNGYVSEWIDYLFHCTDVNNLVNILDCGYLYSREKALEYGVMKNDNADNDVIDHTEKWIYQYASLYFGAKTPTFYWNEGFIPKEKRKDDAHCPVPVYLLFDKTEVMKLDDLIYSDGNLGSSFRHVSSDLSGLSNLPYNDIFHRGYYNPNEHPMRVHNRHAEVAIKERISIRKLEYVACRSKAEKEFLLFILKKRDIEFDSSKIMVNPKLSLFNYDRLFVKEVHASNEIIKVVLNPNDVDRFKGTVDIKYELTDLIEGKKYFRTYRVENNKIKNNRLRLKDRKKYLFKVYFDEILVFENDYDFTNTIEDYMIY